MPGMDENPYRAPVEPSAGGLPPDMPETVAPRLSPIVGLCCLLVVATCAFIALTQLEPGLRDLPGFAFLALNGVAWAITAWSIFINSRRALYASLMFDVAAFLSVFVIVALSGFD